MMMAKDVSQRYQNAADLIEDLDAVSKGGSPQFARPTLDFAKLAKVAKEVPANEVTVQNSSNSSIMSSLLIPLLVVSAIINFILLFLVLL
jgi:hypothetical protein